MNLVSLKTITVIALLVAGFTEAQAQFTYPLWPITNPVTPVIDPLLIINVLKEQAQQDINDASSARDGIWIQINNWNIQNAENNVVAKRTAALTVMQDPRFVNAPPFARQNAIQVFVTADFNLGDATLSLNRANAKWISGKVFHDTAVRLFADGDYQGAIDNAEGALFDFNLSADSAGSNFCLAADLYFQAFTGYCLAIQNANDVINGNFTIYVAPVAFSQQPTQIDPVTGEPYTPTGPNPGF